MKVEFVKLNSMSVTVDNSTEEIKKYEISARVNINEGKVDSIDGGRVVKEGVEVASFSKYGENRSSKQFYGVTAEKETEILEEINNFCFYAIEKVGNEPFKI